MRIYSRLIFPRICDWSMPLQQRAADGCRLNRDIEALIRKGPFREVKVERFLLEGMPRIVGSMYRGTAVK
jgi:hypothetical protein